MAELSAASHVDTQDKIINVSAKVAPKVLAGMLGVDHTRLYAWAQDGRLPSPFANFSYKECLTHLVSSLIKAEEVKKLKLQENIRLREEQQARKAAEAESKGKKSTKFTDFADDGEMHPLLADKVRMTVRKDHATTAQTWQKIAIERGEYIAAKEMEELVKPFILTIRDSLNSIILDFPETQEKIDKVLENLFTVGVQLIEGSELDKENFIETILDTPIEDLQDVY